VAEILRRDIPYSGSVRRCVGIATAWLRGEGSLARSVAESSRQSANEPSPVRIIAVGPTGVSKPVYNLTVEEAHLYYANGVLVSNTDCDDHCADELRYGLMSRPAVQLEPPPPDLTRLHEEKWAKFRPPVVQQPSAGW